MRQLLQKRWLCAKLKTSCFKKAQGAILGNPRNIETAGALGRATQIAAADQFVAALVPVVDAIRNAGARTLEAISRALNEKRIRTARCSLARLDCRQSSRPCTE